MKKRTMFSLLLFYFNITYAQFQATEDSLMKYSYFLQGYVDSTRSISQGTGFFVNNNGENLLVTAKHVLSGCRFNGMKNTDFPDEMLLYYNEDTDLRFNVFPLDVKTIKDTSTCMEYYMSPDIISYPINNTTEEPVFSIEQFLPEYLPARKGKIVIFGYPSYNNIDSGKYFVRPAAKLELVKYTLHESFTYTAPAGFEVIDSINYTIKPADMLLTARLRGYSGSPVFIQDKENAKWVFLGVIIAIDEKNNLLTIVKPKNLFEKIGYKPQLRIPG